MAKLFSPRVSQNFGEAFLSTIDRERKLRQQQQQFQQDQAFRNRQLDFLQTFRQGTLEARSREQDFKERPVIPDPTEQARIMPLGGGFIEERFIKDVEGKETIIGFESLISPDRSGRIKGDLTTPFISKDKLRSAEIRFEDFRNLSDELGRTGEETIKLPDGTELSRERVKVLREQAFDDVVFQTDERAKQLNSIYENFDQAFRRYLKSAEEGKLTKNNIDNIISRDLKGAPADMIKEMKELLKSRVF